MTQPRPKKALSLDEVQARLDKDAKAKATRAAKRGINLSDPENRTVMVWIKLPMGLGYCANPKCPDERPRKVAEGNAMTTELPNGEKCCRICFLAGYGL